MEGARSSTLRSTRTPLDSSPSRLALASQMRANRTENGSVRKSKSNHGVSSRLIGIESQSPTHHRTVGRDVSWASPCICMHARPATLTASSPRCVACWPRLVLLLLCHCCGRAGQAGAEQSMRFHGSTALSVVFLLLLVQLSNLPVRVRGNERKWTTPVSATLSRHTDRQQHTTAGRCLEIHALAFFQVGLGPCPPLWPWTRSHA